MTQSNWKRSIGQIVMSAKDCRLLGLTAVKRGAGVSTICRKVASVMASTGEKTLMVCTSEHRTRSARHGSDKPASASALRAEVVQSVYGYDLLSGRASDALLATYSPTELRDVLSGEFSDYDRIVLDLPPVHDDAGDNFGGASIAAVCDRVLLVCVLGVDQRDDVSEAAAILGSVGAKLAGVVSNEHKRADFMEVLRNSRIFRPAHG